MTEEVFFAHTRTWHCKLLICEGHNPDKDKDEVYIKVEHGDDPTDCNPDAHVLPSSSFTGETSQPFLSENSEATEAAAQIAEIQLKQLPETSDWQEDDMTELTSLGEMQKLNVAGPEQNANEVADYNDVRPQGLESHGTFHLLQHRDFTHRSSLNEPRRHPREKRRAASRRLSAQNVRKRNSMTHSREQQQQLQLMSVHVCRWCKKSFKFYSLLVRHERSHTGDRPFECRVCHRRFTQMVHKQSHEKTHEKWLP